VVVVEVVVVRSPTVVTVVDTPALEIVDSPEADDRSPARCPPTSPPPLAHAAQTRARATSDEANLFMRDL
jgi:hypothetical protein